MAYRHKEGQRAAAKRHYEKNKAQIIARAKAHSEKRRKLLAAYVAEIKNQPCMDCGGRFPPCVMDFDHIDNKCDNVSTMVADGVSLKKIKAEIAKCEIVCANCHRIRTHSRYASRVGGKESLRPHKPGKAGAVPAPAIQLSFLE